MAVPVCAPELPCAPGPKPAQCLRVTFEKDGKCLRRVSSPSGLVRWGQGQRAEFRYPLPGVPATETLFARRWGRTRLLVRPGMTGELWTGGSRLGLEDLEPWGLLRGARQNRGIDLTPEVRGRIEYRGIEVFFEHGELDVPVAVGAGPVSGRFRRALVEREDRPFALIAWVVYAALSVGIAFLMTRPYREESAAVRVPARLARLVYDAPQAQTRAREQILRKNAEQPSSAPLLSDPPRRESEAEPKPALSSPEPKPEAVPRVEPAPAVPDRTTKQKTREEHTPVSEAPGSGRRDGTGSGRGSGAGAGEGTGPGAGPGAGDGQGGSPGDGLGRGIGPGGAPGEGGGFGLGPDAAPGLGTLAGPTMGGMGSREQLRVAVSNKGLLGVLAGRGGASTARAGGSVLEGRGAAGDMDRVLEKVQGIRHAPGAVGGGGGGGGGWAGGGGGGDGSDGGGAEPAPGPKRGVSRNIDDAARQVAAAKSRTVELQQREDKPVETPKTEELDELTLKEAVAAIHRAVGAYLGGIRYLYNRELRKNPDLEGKLTVAITISPDGAVADCKLVESTLGSPELEEAILQRIQKWKFPAVCPRPLTVTYPFVFFPSM